MTASVPRCLATSVIVDLYRLRLSRLRLLLSVVARTAASARDIRLRSVAVPRGWLMKRRLLPCLTAAAVVAVATAGSCCRRRLPPPPCVPRAVVAAATAAMPPVSP